MQKIIAFMLISIASQLYGQIDSVQLIKPTGLHPIGTITYEWIDVSRELQYSTHVGDKRAIKVQIWYPAKPGATTFKAPYSALSKDYLKVSTNSNLRPPFSEKVNNSNIIIISPGRGTEGFLYTAMAEELASHGFVVASVDKSIQFNSLVMNSLLI